MEYFDALSHFARNICPYRMENWCNGKKIQSQGTIDKKPCKLFYNNRCLHPLHPKNKGVSK